MSRAALTLACAACACGAARAPRASRVGAPSSGVHEYVPTRPGAAAYGVPVAEGPRADEATILGAVRAAALRVGADTPTWDGRLARAAADLARALPPDGTPPAELVDFLVWHHGLVGPPPHLLVATVEGGLDAMEEEIRDGLGPVLGGGARLRRVGVGILDSGDGRVRRVVVALQESDLRIESVPRRIEPGDTARVAWSLSPPLARARAFVTRPDGSAFPLAVRVEEGDGFAAEVRCHAGRGAYQVEVTSDGPHGELVVANFPLYCGVDPPRSVEAAAPPPGAASAAAAEAELLALVNRDRRRAGLGPLVADERLTRIARAHSADMAVGGFVGHVSPSTGGPADRVDEAGLEPRLLLENVARAYAPEEVHTGLMSSPGHRRNVLHPEATHAGVGVVLGREVGGRRELWATELFAAYR